MVEDMPHNRIVKIQKDVSELLRWSDQIHNGISDIQKLSEVTVRPIMASIKELNADLRKLEFFDELKDLIKKKFAIDIDNRINIHFSQRLLVLTELNKNYMNAYKDALRSLAILPSIPKIEVPKLKFDEVVDENELDSLLKKLDPKYIDMLVGARQAIKSNNPERIRHGCVSMRQLIVSVLDKLAPEVEGRKEQLRKIIPKSGKNEIKFLNSFIVYINDFVNYISEEVHKDVHYEHVENILFVGERILLLILRRRK